MLLSGMNKPHSLRRCSSGWTIADSRQNSVVFMDDDFWVTSVVSGDFDWVQDAVIHDGVLLVADANHSRLVWWDITGNRELAEIKYSDQWKIYQIEVVEGVWEERLRALRPSEANPRLSFVDSGWSGDGQETSYIEAS